MSLEDITPEVRAAAMSAFAVTLLLNTDPKRVITAMETMGNINPHYPDIIRRVLADALLHMNPLAQKV